MEQSNFGEAEKENKSQMRAYVSCYAKSVSPEAFYFIELKMAM